MAEYKYCTMEDLEDITTPHALAASLFIIARVYATIESSQVATGRTEC